MALEKAITDLKEASQQGDVYGTLTVFKTLMHRKYLNSNSKGDCEDGYQALLRVLREVALPTLDVPLATEVAEMQLQLLKRHEDIVGLGAANGWLISLHECGRSAIDERACPIELPSTANPSAVEVSGPLWGQAVQAGARSFVRLSAWFGVFFKLYVEAMQWRNDHFMSLCRSKKEVSPNTTAVLLSTERKSLSDLLDPLVSAAFAVSLSRLMAIHWGGDALRDQVSGAIADVICMSCCGSQLRVHVERTIPVLATHFLSPGRAVEHIVAVYVFEILRRIQGDASHFDPIPFPSCGPCVCVQHDRESGFLAAESCIELARRSVPSPECTWFNFLNGFCMLARLVAEYAGPSGSEVALSYSRLVDLMCSSFPRLGELPMLDWPALAKRFNAQLEIR